MTIIVIIIVIQPGSQPTLDDCTNVFVLQLTNCVWEFPHLIGARGLDSVVDSHGQGRDISLAFQLT